MARPFTRAQALQNAAFLSHLRRCGNVRLACREVGLKYGTMQHRRRVQPGFAARWDAALVFAQARLTAAPRALTRRFAPPSPARGEGPGKHGFKTSGGEPHLVRLKNGKLQMRRAAPGRLTPAAEQAFLAAVSATCNLSLAAAAVGACFGSFNKRRKKDPAFARELRLALAQGWERLEMGLMESSLPDSHEHDEWRHNDPPALPPMSAAQALQLMYLHQKAALLVEEPTPMRRRRGESREACGERLAQMAEARDARAREAFEVAEAERMMRGEAAWGPAGERVRTALAGVDLAQVTGWSRADPAKAAEPQAPALFGGWRIAEMEQRLEEGHGSKSHDRVGRVRSA